MESKTIVQVRIPNDLLVEIDDLAREQQRSRSNMIVVLLRKIIENWESCKDRD